MKSIRERRTTNARAAATVSPPSGVSVSWWGRVSQPQAFSSAVAPPGVGSAVISAVQEEGVDAAVSLVKQMREAIDAL